MSKESILLLAKNYLVLAQEPITKLDDLFTSELMEEEYGDNKSYSIEKYSKDTEKNAKYASLTIDLTTNNKNIQINYRNSHIDKDEIFESVVVINGEKNDDEVTISITKEILNGNNTEQEQHYTVSNSFDLTKANFLANELTTANLITKEPCNITK